MVPSVLLIFFPRESPRMGTAPVFYGQSPPLIARNRVPSISSFSPARFCFVFLAISVKKHEAPLIRGDSREKLLIHASHSPHSHNSRFTLPPPPCFLPELRLQCPSAAAPCKQLTVFLTPPVFRTTLKPWWKVFTHRQGWFDGFVTGNNNVRRKNEDTYPVSMRYLYRRLRNG